MLNELRRWVDPRLWTVRVRDVRSYLERKGWNPCAATRPHQLAFEEPGTHPDGPARLYLPDSEQFSDYPQRLLEVVTAIAELEDRYAVDVLNDILCRPGSNEPNGVSPRATPATAPASNS